VEHGYHVYSDAQRVHVPDGSDRLAQSVCAVVAAVEHLGYGVLCGSVGGGLEPGLPEVFNTDQGVQFTSASFTGRVESAGAQVSMDGKGRCLDNVFVERLWRTVKYEYVYLWRPEAGAGADGGFDDLLRLLQRAAVAPVAGGSDTGRGLWAGIEVEEALRCVLGGMAPVPEGQETAPGPPTWRGHLAVALSVHRRPSYPLAGCSPAEPASVSPGAKAIHQGGGRSKSNQVCRSGRRARM